MLSRVCQTESLLLGMSERLEVERDMTCFWLF